MAGDLRSPRKIALEKGTAPGTIETPEVPDVNKPQYTDRANAAQPQTFGGQNTPTDPSPFANLRGKS